MNIHLANDRGQGNAIVATIPANYEVALSDEQGPLIAYNGCGSHQIRIDPRLLQKLGMSEADIEQARVATESFR